MTRTWLSAPRTILASMPNDPASVLELTVALDYGQFYLLSWPVQDDHIDLIAQVAEAAIKRQGIATSERNEVVAVISPHQNNFAMRLRIEVWAAEPPDDLDDWQEAFGTGLVAGERGLRYESPTVAWETIAVPPGRYAARITGRGFVQRGWPGSTKPGDRWRVQLWPAAKPMPARRLRAWAGPGPTDRVPIDLAAYTRRIQTGSCFVCGIVGGDPGYEHEQVVFEDDAHIAFLDRYPTVYGKVLVAPKAHIEQVVRDLPRQAFLELLAVVHNVARAVETVVASERTYLLSLGSQQANAHVHWHIAPLPPGTPFERQQFQALMLHYGMIPWSAAQAAELAGELRAVLART